MISSVPTATESDTTKSGPEINKETDEPVLCNHCGRTASNGLVCIGMCVADSGY